MLFMGVHLGLIATNC